MNSISNYLNKFFVISPPGKFYQNETVKVLNDIFRIQLKPEEIEVRFGEIYIKKQNPILKNEIFFNKKQILEQINQKLKNHEIKNIRF
ncbi:DUF721 domain-containing protein [Candidatus Parcubacteria bacterium]|nr:MAG: DUF721 domain-containing protein [Candidatus Parcubacteria bacterium]